MKNNHFTYNIITIILLFAYSLIGYSQPITWYRTWGIYERGEQSKRVVQTFDGGYASMIILSYGSGTSYFNLLKYDYLGNFLWYKVIVDTTDRMLFDMQQTQDSGFIFAGYTFGALLIKTDKNGNLQWQRNYPNLNPGTVFGSVRQTSDKGYIASGDYTDYVNPSSKGIVIKVDSLGYIQWEKEYMDSIQNGFGNIIQGLDGKYYVVGTTQNNYPSKHYATIKKLDLLGNIIWNKIFYTGGSASYIEQLKDGSIITGAGVDSFTFSNRPLLAKLDTAGNIKWVKYYPSPYLWFQYMSKDLFDRIVLTGLYHIGGGINTIGIWKLDTGGTVINTKQLSFSGYNYIGSSCINRTSDSGYVLVGQVTLTDSLFNPHPDALIIKTDSNFNTPLITGINFINSNYVNEFKLFQNYPNPFNPITNIKYQIQKTGLVTMKIYDITGREIKTLVNEIKNPGNYIVTLNGSELASGVYFYKIQAGDFIQVKKMVLIK